MLPHYPCGGSQSRSCRNNDREAFRGLDGHDAPMDLQELYNRDGYVIVRSVVEAPRVAGAKQHALQTRARFPDDTPEQLHRRPLWLEDPFYHRFVNQPKLLDLAEAIL